MGIVNLLGAHALFGGLITVLAGIACLAWDYSRLEHSGRFFVGVVTARRIGITLATISIILMLSRFVSVVRLNGG
jgi:hypothetical protein